MQIEFTRASISSEAAFAAVGAAVEHGRSLGKPMVAAIVDASGDTVALLRADGAFKASITISQDKAYTAAVFGASTDALAAAFAGKPVLQQGLALRPNVVLFGGGSPIVSNGKVIGGVGVSGGSEEEDRTCAQIALAKLGLKQE